MFRTGVIVFLVSWVWIRGESCAAETLDRVWSIPSQNLSVRAELIAVTEHVVRLKLNDGEEQEIPLAELSEADQAIAKAALSCDVSARLFSRVQEHRLRFVNSPAAVSDLLTQLHQSSEHDFAAGLYAGTLSAFTRSPDRLKQAKKQLDSTIARLKQIRKSLPHVHETTLAIALNNRAIVALREDEAPRALAFLVQAASTSENMPFAVYHNATLMLEVAASAGKFAKLSKSAQAKLAKAVATASPDMPGTKVPKRFVYALTHDPFRPVGSKALPETDATPPKPTAGGSPSSGIEPGFELLGNGSGFLISPTLVVTNRHVIEGLSDGRQFLVRNETSFRQGVIANVIATSKDKDVDLALLGLPQPRPEVRPIPIRRQPAKPGEEFLVLGYPKTDVFGEVLNSSRGIVSSVSNDGKNVVHDATSNPGNSGGPCLDACGNALGVLYAGGRDEAAGRNFAVSGVATLAFAEAESDYEPLVEREDSIDPVQRIEIAKEAVVRVEVHGKPKTASVTANARLDDDLERIVNLALLGLLPELTCLDCKGRGFAPCKNCGADGIISKVHTVPKYIDPKAGTVSSTEIFTTQCPACAGNGGHPCSSCTKGVLSLF